MGEYSHVCNVSKIAITPNQRCVLIPLIQTVTRKGVPCGSYTVGLLPIFGTYSGYGDLEDIEEDKNTDYICSKFNQPIEEFVNCIMRAEYDGEVYPEYANWMLVDRLVWDDLTTNQYDTQANGAHLMGNTEYLTYLGFEYKGVDPTRDRYNIEYHYNGTTVWTDGRYIEDDIYNFSDLKAIVDLPKKFDWLANASLAQAWPTYLKDAKTLDSVFTSLFTNNTNVFSMLKNKNGEELYAPSGSSFYRSPVIFYFTYFTEFADMFCALHTFRNNCALFSTGFTPQDNSLTMQYGAHTAHAKILQKFADICKQYTVESE